MNVRDCKNSPAPAPLNRAKFRDPLVTANGEKRARVALDVLRTLWINTGTLCNLSCAGCYIESTPRNDRLVWISAAEAGVFLDEIARDHKGVREIGFTGGEPFMNPDIVAMLDDALGRGLRTLVLTNAMKPMQKLEPQLLDLRARFGERLAIRVSVDHYTRQAHEAERGAGSWKPTIDGLVWLSQNNFAVSVASRMISGESDAQIRAGFGELLARLGVAIDVEDPAQLVIFPEMDASVDVPEITESCWGILHKSPSDVMCATSRMVVKRKGAQSPVVLACTLLAYDERFELGATLREASGDVALNHPHCAKFCVLGGAACSAG